MIDVLTTLWEVALNANLPEAVLADLAHHVISPAYDMCVAAATDTEAMECNEAVMAAWQAVKEAVDSGRQSI